MQRILPANIGFGIVKRRFESPAGKWHERGEELTRDFLLSMPQGNRDAMMGSNQIEIFPRSVAMKVKGPVAAAGVGEKHRVTRGFGKYDVIQGTIIAQGVTKEEADKIVAGETLPADKPPPERKRRAAPSTTRRRPKRAATKRAAKRTVAKAAKPPRVAKRRAPRGEAQANGPIE